MAIVINMAGIKVLKMIKLKQKIGDKLQEHFKKYPDQTYLECPFRISKVFEAAVDIAEVRENSSFTLSMNTLAVTAYSTLLIQHENGNGHKKYIQVLLEKVIAFRKVKSNDYEILDIGPVKIIGTNSQ